MSQDSEIDGTGGRIIITPWDGAVISGLDNTAFIINEEMLIGASHAR